MHNYDLFDAYLQDELSNQEKISFENRLQNDASLQEEFDSYNLVRDSFDYMEMKRLETKISSQLTMTNPKKIKWWPIAASIALVAVVGSLLFSANFGQDYYADYFTPFEEEMTTLGSGTNLLSPCLEEYSKKNYSTSISCLESLEPTAEVYFYTGMSHMANENFEEAYSVLTKVEELGEKYLEESNWYAAIAAIQLNKIEEAKSRLDLIVSNDNSNYQKTSATNLLRDLD